MALILCNGFPQFEEIFFGEKDSVGCRFGARQKNPSLFGNWNDQAPSAPIPPDWQPRSSSRESTSESRFSAILDDLDMNADSIA